MSRDVAAIGVDIGGTTIKLGLVSSYGAILARRRIAYRGLGDFAALVDAVASAAASLRTDAALRIVGLGLAAPGHARPGDGLMVDGTGNVPLLRDRALAPAIRARLDLPVVTLNDGIAATIGEMSWGAGRGVRRFALLTLGTGVGGGIVIDGVVVTGDGGVPPELGAIVLADGADGPRTLEDFASARGFLAAYAAQGGTAAGPDAIVAAAASGDALAGRVLDAVARRIAQATGTLVNALNLERCLLGGGIAQAGEPLRGRVAACLGDFTWPFLHARVSLRLAETGVDAGVLGAAAQAMAGAVASPVPSSRSGGGCR